MAALPYAKDELSVKIKILNCKNLLVGDTISSDPYVRVLLGKTELHKTKHLIKTLNPVFGQKDNNEFDTQFFWGDLTKKGGLTFEVHDWDLVGKDDFIGFVKISPSDLLKMASSLAPTTFTLEPPPNKKAKKGAGTITLSAEHTSTTGVKSKYWVPPRASVAARRSTRVNPDSIATSDEESLVSRTSAPDYDKELFIEILSCKNLLSRDANGLSDPYVKVHMGKRFLHRTAVIEKTLNPVFTAQHKNSFILDCDALNLWEADGLKLRVKDHDDGINALGFTNDDLGSVMVSAEKLYEASGVKMKFNLTPPKDSREYKRGMKAGSITIRVREATEEDKQEIKDRSGFFKKTVATPKTQAKKFVPEVDITGIDKKILLVEVLSCRELLAFDKNRHSDPYVLAKLGFKEIHKTDHVDKTLNPVFTAEDDNSFVVDCSVSELYGANGILIKVIDYDRGIISGDDELGSVQIPANTMYECRETEYHLDPPLGHGEDAGYVTIRITEISEEQRALHKKGKLVISKTVMPSGLDTSERESIASGSNFKDMPDKILLVEILSCRDLIASDKNGLSDPYVRARMGKKDLHKTNRVNKTLNPVFTSEQHNSFLITCSKSELAGAQGILVRVVDWDRGIGGDDDLGWVQIQAESLYECNLQEYHLNAPYGRSEDAGYVTIRTTELTEEEREEHTKGKLAAIPAPPPPPPAPPSEAESPTSTDVKSMSGYNADVRVTDPDVQEMSKPYFDPDERIIAEEEKKFKILLAAVVASSILLVFLTVSGITGRSARSGEPSLGVVEQIGRVGDPYTVRNISIPGGGCVDLPGWTDVYGYGCDHYTEDENDCEEYAEEVGSDGKTPIEACCVCQHVSSSCVDLAGWMDFFEDSCDWYEDNEPVGCPGEGHVNGTDGVNASEACCHCRTPGVNEIGDTRGRWSDIHQVDKPLSRDISSLGADIAEGEAVWTLLAFVLLGVMLLWFCLCCFG